MGDFLRRIRLPLLFAGLLLLTLVLMLQDRGSPARGSAPVGADRGGSSSDAGRLDAPGFGLPNSIFEIAAPLQKALASPVDWLGETWANYVALVDLRGENDGLLGRIAELEEENLQFREALVASGHLEGISRMRDGFEVPMLPAQVVGQDVSSWFHAILVDRGRRAEVLSGMPIVSEHGLVGVVTATSARASRAMLLLDRRSAADAIVQRSRARGIVRGTGSGELEFVFMVRGDDVLPGDVVITSGFGGVYPKGVRIGQVTEVNTDRAELLHKARVTPAVDFGHLEQVFVMLRRAPTMDLLYAGDGDLADPAGEEEVAAKESVAP
ncbi:MAG: rod shape-determining protein MreC [Deltaproteobacteria bacterium]|nr:rod shape-determining protein MreC [Deltaproteobacteria bacterium]MBW2393437.1 rod shape-determining protein MreC [Deltaproteobacteria bacterium]